MKRLLVAAALAPLTFAAQTSAQTTSDGTTTVSSTVYAPVVSNGNNVTIKSGGTITPYTPATSSGVSYGGTATAPVAALTISANTSGSTGTNIVTNSGVISFDAGAINGASYKSTNYAIGILANGGVSGSIGNAGTISLIETTNYTDTNNDGILDSNNGVSGQYATGTNRFGIATSDSGLFTGGVANAGTITIVGENSAGILIGKGGMTGILGNSGTISVTGGNAGATSDHTYGIHTTGKVTGLINLTGTISATGQNASAVTLDGDVAANSAASQTGSVYVAGTITATGYRSTVAPTAPSLLTAVSNQASAELLQGGPALAINGSVAGGIDLAAPIAATGSTAAIAGAVVSSDGRAPALLIGGAVASGLTQPSAITLGASTADAIKNPLASGLLIGGTVTGVGVYDVDNVGVPVGANAVEIGTAAQVTIANGMTVTGSVSASAISRTDPLLKTATLPDGTTFTDANGATFYSAATAINLNDVVLTPASGSQFTATLTTTSGSTTTTTTTLLNTGALYISGTVSATSNAIVPTYETAILIGANSQVPSLTNTGVISASIGGISAVVNSPAAGGISGYASAIVDKSGTLSTINNYGTINASISPIQATATVDATNSRVIAIDLSKNTGVATLNQDADPLRLAVDSSTGKTTVVAPVIVGDILFGATGSGVLNLNAGSVSGGLYFGSGQNNAITVNNGATFAGGLSESVGGKLTINVNNGTLDITSPVTNIGPVTTVNTGAGDSVIVTGSTVTTLTGGLSTATTSYVNNPTQAQLAPIGVKSLTVGSAGTLVMTVNGASSSNQAQLSVSGAVNIASGGTIGLNFQNKLVNPATYTLISANPGAITLGNVNTVVGALPFLYTGSIVQSAVASGQIEISVSQKTAAQLQLNPAEAAAYSAIYAAFDKADTVGTGSISTAVLGATNRADFLHIYDQFLPDYQGGPFEGMVLAQQSLAQTESDSSDKMEGDGSRGWVQEIGYINGRDSSSQVNGYNGKGFGVAGGIEHAYGHSAVGVALAFVSNSVHDDGRSVGSSQGSNAVEVGAYWRTGGQQGFSAGATINGGVAVQESRRVLMEQSGTADATLYRLAKANWIGGVGSTSFQVAYKASFGRYYVKPELLANYILFYEQAYTEHGGGDAFDLHIGSKLSQEAVVQTDLVLGANYGAAVRWSPELTLGWREVVAGGPADVTANFAGGTAFKLSPNYGDRGGLLARLGIRASGNFADFSANAGGVFMRQGYNSYDARASARFLF